MKFKYFNMKKVRDICTGGFFLASIVIPNLDRFSGISDEKKLITSISLVGCALISEFMPSFGVESKENRELIKKDREARQFKLKK